MELHLHIAKEISKDSWLNDPEYKWFKDAYGYAATQSRAIPALSQCTPEEMYWAFICIKAGIARND